MNPDYRGTRPLNQAFADRFSIRLSFPYDKAIESKLLKCKALVEMANQLRDEFNKGTLATPISTRSLVAFVTNAKTLGMEFAINNYINSFEGDEERSAVRLVVNTHRDNIAEELGLAVLSIKTDETKVEMLEDNLTSNSTTFNIPITNHTAVI